jgi:creatinine amidohydrolase
MLATRQQKAALQTSTVQHPANPGRHTTLRGWPVCDGSPGPNLRAAARGLRSRQPGCRGSGAVVGDPEFDGDMAGPSRYHYGEMTWPRVREAAAARRVAVVPVATLEDHGFHLPVDTDVRLCCAACDRAVARVPEKAVLVPPVIHGYSPHHMDFPGTVTIAWDTFIRYLLDVCKSLAAHGFARILIVNGHGSNTPFVDIVARLTVVETTAVAAAINYWNAPGVREVAESLRESDAIGGMNHACEFETSLYLALRPDLVDMSRAVRELGHEPTKNYWTDLVAGDGPLMMMEHWSALSRSGVMGDPTKASAAKGERLLEAIATGLAEIIDELRERRTPQRIDHH